MEHFKQRRHQHEDLPKVYYCNIQLYLILGGEKVIYYIDKHTELEFLKNL